jgi:hypothetical protein
MTTPQWGPPPPPQDPTPHPPKRQRRLPRNRWIGNGNGVLILLAIIGAVASNSGTTAHRSGTAVTTPTTPSSAPADETFPDEGITQTTAAATATGRVGETVTLSEASSGEEVAQVVVDRVKVAGGDEYNRPDRGLWLGVHVKTKALADGQTSLWGDLYVVERGHHYDADGCCPEGFTPDLDYVDLNEGETAEGWLVFDVPARHGQVVLKNSSDDSKIATWTF